MGRLKPIQSDSRFPDGPSASQHINAFLLCKKDTYEGVCSFK